LQKALIFVDPFAEADEQVSYIKLLAVIRLALPSKFSIIAEFFISDFYI
jgi:hypothetical protein